MQCRKDDVKESEPCTWYCFSDLSRHSSSSEKSATWTSRRSSQRRPTCMGWVFGSVHSIIEKTNKQEKGSGSHKPHPHSSLILSLIYSSLSSIFTTTAHMSTPCIPHPFFFPSTTSNLPVFFTLTTTHSTFFHSSFYLI